MNAREAEALAWKWAHQGNCHNDGGDLEDQSEASCARGVSTGAGLRMVPRRGCTYRIRCHAATDVMSQARIPACCWVGRLPNSQLGRTCGA